MRHKLLGLSGWVLAGVVLLVGAGKTEETRVRRLVVEDSQGRDRIVMGEREDKHGGGPIIELLDTEGNRRIELRVTKGNNAGVTISGDGKNLSTIMMGVERGDRARPIVMMTTSGGDMAITMTGSTPSSKIEIAGETGIKTLTAP